VSPQVCPHPTPPPLAGEGAQCAGGGSGAISTLPCMRGREGPAPQAGEGGSCRTVGSALAQAAAALEAAQFDEPRRLARRALGAALHRSPAELFARPESALTAAEEAEVAAVLGRMTRHEPLSRIIGKREFWGLEFLLTADTLDPRPESETIVEAVLARLADRTRRYRFLDLGTGTGCLLLALLTEFPRASGVGVDVAPGAARAAQRNAGRLGLGDRTRFVVGDWARAVAGPFDAVVANPPYIATAAIAGLPPEVRDHDPHRALDGGADGFFAYRAIAADLPRLLAPVGFFVAEIGIGQAAAVGAILARNGLAIDGFTPDLAGITRCIIARR
jgi:release factor glutamine methyltransferase